MFPAFEKLGGLGPTLDLIAATRRGAERRGQRPSNISLYRWKKGGVPGWVQTILANECAKRGVPCSFDDMKWREATKNAKRRA